MYFVLLGVLLLLLGGILKQPMAVERLYATVNHPSQVTLGRRTQAEASILNAA